ncbi:MAG: hypothetical protein AB8G22_05965 [Saprospiraceae bacterium]
MAKFHGNDKRNSNPHHLYFIGDKKEDDTFKFGISQEEIDEDDLSDRIREQVDYANLIVGWIRFFGKIILRNIPGNARARKIEDEFIQGYFRKNGRYPRGNRDRDTNDK